MRIKTEFLVELCADPKSHRMALGAIKFDKEQAICVATDAKIMSKVPCEPEDDDETCLIPLAVWEQARKLAKATKSSYIFIKCKVNEVTLENGSKHPTCTASFPNWERVKNDAQLHIDEAGHIKLSINPEYILDLAKSLGDKTKIELTIPLPTEGNSRRVDKAIMAKNPATWAEGSIGLIMPMM